MRRCGCALRCLTLHLCGQHHCRSVGSASTWSLERIAALAEECTVTFYAKLHVRARVALCLQMPHGQCGAVRLSCRLSTLACGVQAAPHLRSSSLLRPLGCMPGGLECTTLSAATRDSWSSAIQHQLLPTHSFRVVACLQDLGVVDTVLSVANQVPDSTLLTLHTDLVKSYPTQLILVRGRGWCLGVCQPLLSSAGLCSCMQYALP